MKYLRLFKTLSGFCLSSVSFADFFPTWNWLFWGFGLLVRQNHHNFSCYIDKTITWKKCISRINNIQIAVGCSKWLVDGLFFACYLYMMSCFPFCLISYISCSALSMLLYSLSSSYMALNKFFLPLHPLTLSFDFLFMSFCFRLHLCTALICWTGSEDCEGWAGGLPTGWRTY